MDGFSKGHQKILVTTDLASRGLDLVNVSLVINFDMPKHTEEFIHRIGRTGRAGSKGDAIAFVGPKDWLSFKNVEGLLEQSISFDKVEGLAAKFKGLKPKKAKANTSKAKVTKVEQSKSPKVKKAPKKIFHAAEDVGDMPIIKRKKPLSSQQIEDSDFDEVD
jgi:superfamily II DNA/RNA helicase